MASNASLILVPWQTNIVAQKKGLIGVTLYYETPNSRKESTTKITYRVITSDRSLCGSGELQQGPLVEENGPQDITIDAGYFSTLLSSSLVNNMRVIQPRGVIYRKVKIDTYERLEWNAPPGTTDSTGSAVTETS